MKTSPIFVPMFMLLETCICHAESPEFTAFHRSLDNPIKVNMTTLTPAEAKSMLYTIRQMYVMSDDNSLVMIHGIAKQLSRFPDIAISKAYCPEFLDSYDVPLITNKSEEIDYKICITTNFCKSIYATDKTVKTIGMVDHPSTFLCSCRNVLKQEQIVVKFIRTNVTDDESIKLKAIYDTGETIVFKDPTDDSKTRTMKLYSESPIKNIVSNMKEVKTDIINSVTVDGTWVSSLKRPEATDVSNWLKSGHTIKTILTKTINGRQVDFWVELFYSKQKTKNSKIH